MWCEKNRNQNFSRANGQTGDTPAGWFRPEGFLVKFTSREADIVY